MPWLIEQRSCTGTRQALLVPAATRCVLDPTGPLTEPEISRAEPDQSRSAGVLQPRHHFSISHDVDERPHLEVAFSKSVEMSTRVPGAHPWVAQ